MAESESSLPKPRGYDAWVAVVRNYQKCSRVMSIALESIDLSVAQHEVLLTIGRRHGLTQRELAERLLVVKSNVSGLLQRLERRGLVQRTPDPDDARSKRISLTPAGRQRLERSFALQAQVVDAMMGTMDDREIEQNREFNRRVGEALDRLLAEHGSTR